MLKIFLFQNSKNKIKTKINKKKREQKTTKQSLKIYMIEEELLKLECGWICKFKAEASSRIIIIEKETKIKTKQNKNNRIKFKKRIPLFSKSN